MADHDYPWYVTVKGDDLVQGDIIEDCPVFTPPEDLSGSEWESLSFTWERQNCVVMSQTCDLVKGREKLTEVLLCPLWGRSELTEGFLSTPKGLEEARRGNLPGYHVLAECGLTGWKREIRLVDFRRVYSLPLALLRRHAEGIGERLRLLPPYREHLSQSFARFFMRVGLPVDVPPFR